jgi:GTP-binding protein HflX
MTPSDRGPRRSLRDRAREQREHDASPRSTNSSGERVFLIGIDARHGPKRDGPSSPDPDALAPASVDDDLNLAAPPFPRRTRASHLTPGLRAARAAAHATDSAKLSRTPEFSAEESLNELRELAISAGATIAGEFLQYRDRLDPATLIGKGKLEEIAAAVAAQEVNVVIFDHELSPSQQRNIERIVETRVVDRTQLILDIFARAARTREGQLQVELAQLHYMLPRLGGRGIEMSQLGGGIGTRGPGETQLETDRRKINRRIRHLESQIEEVRRNRAQQRQRREAAPIATVALVGYTNAGKSTTFNAITKAGVFESAKMFATLDPTIRAIQLPSKRRVLLSDTVGFIRHLPHTLVTAFRATLEEVERAAIILHVSDATSPILPEQDAQVMEVLRELGADRKPRIHVMNKVDLLEPRQRESLIDTPLPHSPVPSNVAPASSAAGRGLVPHPRAGEAEARVGGSDFSGGVPFKPGVGLGGEQAGEGQSGAPFKPDIGLSGGEREALVPHLRAGEAEARVGNGDSNSPKKISVDQRKSAANAFDSDFDFHSRKIGVNPRESAANAFDSDFDFHSRKISVNPRESAANGFALVGTAPAVHISAATGQGLTALLEYIDAMLEDDPLRRVHLRIPQSEGKVLSQIEAGARIFSRKYADGAVVLDIQAPESLVRKVREWMVPK